MTGLLLASSGHLLASGDDDLGAGFIAFMVVVVLSVACYFLFRSMSRHLNKVPTSFDPPAPPAASDRDDAYPSPQPMRWSTPNPQRGCGSRLPASPASSGSTAPVGSRRHNGRR